MMNTASADVARGHQGGDAAFLAVAALIFGSAALATIHQCLAMPMLWMRMPGQSWPEAAADFLGMWVVMMVAMMLPSLVPMLSRYRHSHGGRGARRVNLLTLLVSIGYFGVWSAIGVAAFPVGIALTELETRAPGLARAAPSTAGLLLLAAGLLQFTKWKAQHLACCRQESGHGHASAADAATAWRHGLRHGLHCSYCCAGPTLVLLALGAMDLRLMAIVTVVITIERLAPASERIAKAIGTVAVAAGLLLIA